MSAVGLQVGYDSEAAFSRAFKKATGVPPAAWRTHHARPPAGVVPAPSSRRSSR